MIPKGRNLGNDAAVEASTGLNAPSRISVMEKEEKAYTDSNTPKPGQTAGCCCRKNTSMQSEIVRSRGNILGTEDRESDGGRTHSKMVGLR